MYKILLICNHMEKVRSSRAAELIKRQFFSLSIVNVLFFLPFKPPHLKLVCQVRYVKK